MRRGSASPLAAIFSSLLASGAALCPSPAGAAQVTWADDPALIATDLLRKHYDASDPAPTDDLLAGPAADQMADEDQLPLPPLESEAPEDAELRLRWLSQREQVGLPS